MPDKGNNDKKRNRILFDFDSVVDLKLSLIHYLNPAKDLTLLKFKRMYVYEDILKDISIPEDYIMENPSRPVFTGMRLLITQYLHVDNSLIRPTVLCRDEFQQRIIKNSLPKVRTVCAAREKINTLNFTRIVLGNPYDALEFTDPTTVDFMLLNFREYFDKDDPTVLPHKVLFGVGDVNSFTIAKAYPEIPDPVG